MDHWRPDVDPLDGMLRTKKPKMEYCTKSSNNSLNSKGQLCAVCNNSRWCKRGIYLFFVKTPICLGPRHICTFFPCLRDFSLGHDCAEPVLYVSVDIPDVSTVTEILIRQQMLHLYVQLYITRVSTVIQFSFIYIAPFTIKIVSEHQLKTQLSTELVLCVVCTQTHLRRLHVCKKRAHKPLVWF